MIAWPCSSECLIIWTNLMRKTALWTLAVFAGAAAAQAHASALESSMLRADETPPGCQQITGAYPAGPKADALYRYKVYRSVLPAVTDRQLESFDCAGQKGTVYFF